MGQYDSIIDSNCSHNYKFILFGRRRIFFFFGS